MSACHLVIIHSVSFYKQATSQQVNISTKRKLNLKSIQDKYQAIKAVEAGIKKKGDIAKEFGIPPNTLSTWLKNKEKITNLLCCVELINMKICTAPSGLRTKLQADDSLKRRCLQLSHQQKKITIKISFFYYTTNTG